jgi:aspartokinase
MKVMKFGGTSVGKPERMHEVAQLITKDAEPKSSGIECAERHHQCPG